MPKLGNSQLGDPWLLHLGKDNLGGRNQLLEGLSTTLLLQLEVLKAVPLGLLGEVVPFGLLP